MKREKDGKNKNYNIVLEMVGYSLEAKANSKNAKFLEHCENNEFPQALKLLRGVTNIDIQSDSAGFTPLLHAIDKENYEAAKAFIKEGANVNFIVSDSSGDQTCALDLLARQKFSDEIGELIQLIMQNDGKLDLVIRGFDLVTAIIGEDNGKFIKFLFEHNYIVNDLPSISYGYSVSEAAIILSKPRVVEACFANGIKPNKKFLDLADYTARNSNKTAENSNKIFELIKQAWENNTNQDFTKEGEVNPEAQSLLGASGKYGVEF